MLEDLGHIKREHETVLNEEEAKQDGARMELHLQEGEKNLKQLRLEFLLNNQKKIMMQKKFLEEQLDKDVKALAN